MYFDIIVLCPRCKRLWKKEGRCLCFTRKKRRLNVHRLYHILRYSRGCEKRITQSIKLIFEKIIFLYFINFRLLRFRPSLWKFFTRETFSICVLFVIFHIWTWKNRVPFTFLSKTF